MTTDWEPEPRPVPDGLEADLQAEPYRDPWNSIMERIETADRDTLMALFGGHPTDATS